jgi:hypothetical protein
MTNKQKVKGSAWESQAVKLLQDGIQDSRFQRVVGSGAIGTSMNEPLLTGDIKGEIKHFPMKLRGEAKAGYNHSTTEAKSFSVKKEWFDKIKKEAKQTYSFPFLICKFDNVHSGVKLFVSLDIDDFIYLMNYIHDIHQMIEEENSNG